MEWDGMKRYENRREVEPTAEHKGKEREKMDEKKWMIRDGKGGRSTLEISVKSSLPISSI